MAVVTNPVRVEAELERDLSRWLWLVKWLLAIPHFFLLAFLWIAFFVLTVVAFFAILFTGRYPRSIFDFNVGVLRWSWRVASAYGALGTIGTRPSHSTRSPDYPARLEIRYPERLSRGLVLVKWWLLAMPHYIVVGLFLGSGTWMAWRGGRWQFAWGAGLIGLLVLVAAVALAVTSRYPSGVYDFVMGMDRWVLRVAAYAGRSRPTSTRRSGSTSAARSPAGRSRRRRPRRRFQRRLRHARTPRRGGRRAASWRWCSASSFWCSRSD